MITIQPRLPLLTAAILALLALAGCPQRQAATKIRIQGSTTVNPVMVKVAEALRAARAMKITVDTQGGSSGGISAAGEGTADIGMASKPVSEKDRARFPEIELKEHIVGFDAVALVVSAPVYDGGVKALTREQIQGIFNGAITNWKAVGGPDSEIFIYNKEPGRGTLAIFEKYVFGGSRKERPSLRNYAEVGANEETRQKIESHDAAVGQLSASWVEGRDKIKAVALKTEAGDILPSAENLKKGLFPMVRELRLITQGEPRGAIKEVVDFTLSERGQAFVKDCGYIPATGI